MPPKTIPFAAPAKIPFSGAQDQRPLHQNIWAQLAIGAAKGLGDTVRGTGDQLATILPNAVGGPLLSAIPQARNAAAQGAKAIQNAEGLTDQNLNATNDYQRVGKVIEGAAELATGAGAVKRVKAAAEFTKGVIDAVAPKLTARVTEQALAEGRGKVSPILKKTSVDFSEDPHVKRMADAVIQNVPDFDPKKSLVENLNATRTAVYGLADQLKQQVAATGKDIIFPFKELASQLKAVERPVSLTRDLEPVYERVQTKLLQIVKQNGGKLSDLFEARKEFDQYVRDHIPNLYDKEGAPIREAVTDMRRAVNDFIAEHLPKDIGFHDSLTTQSRLFDAIDNMAEKAAAGSEKEVGKTAAGRFLNRHPTAKKALNFGLGAAVGGGTVGLIKN